MKTCLLCIRDENSNYFYVKEGKLYFEFRQDPKADNYYLVVHNYKGARTNEGTFFKNRFIEIPYNRYVRLLLE